MTDSSEPELVDELNSVNLHSEESPQHVTTLSRSNLDTAIDNSVARHGIPVLGGILGNSIELRHQSESIRLINKAKSRIQVDILQKLEELEKCLDKYQLGDKTEPAEASSALESVFKQRQELIDHIRISGMFSIILLNQAISKVRDIENENSSLQKKVQNMKDEITTLRTLVNSHEDTIRGLNTNILDLQDRVKKLEEDKKALQSDNDLLIRGQIVYEIQKELEREINNPDACQFKYYAQDKTLAIVQTMCPMINTEFTKLDKYVVPYKQFTNACWNMKQGRLPIAHPQKKHDDLDPAKMASISTLQLKRLCQNDQELAVLKILCLIRGNSWIDGNDENAPENKNVFPFNK